MRRRTGGFRVTALPEDCVPGRYAAAFLGAAGREAGKGSSDSEAARQMREPGRDGKAFLEREPFREPPLRTGYSPRGSRQCF